MTFLKEKKMWEGKGSAWLSGIRQLAEAAVKCESFENDGTSELMLLPEIFVCLFVVKGIETDKQSSLLHTQKWLSTHAREGVGPSENDLWRFRSPFGVVRNSAGAFAVGGETIQHPSPFHVHPLMKKVCAEGAWSVSEYHPTSSVYKWAGYEFDFSVFPFICRLCTYVTYSSIQNCHGQSHSKEFYYL